MLALRRFFFFYYFCCTNQQPRKIQKKKKFQKKFLKRTIKEEQLKKCLCVAYALGLQFGIFLFSPFVFIVILIATKRRNQFIRFF